MEAKNTPPESTLPVSEPRLTPIYSDRYIHERKLKQTLDLSRIELSIAEHKKWHAEELICAFKICTSETEEPVSYHEME